MAFLLVSSAGIGSAIATTTGSTVQNTTTQTTTETVTVNYTVQSSYTKVGKQIKLKTKTENGNNVAANWTITAPNGTVVDVENSTSNVAWTPQQAGNYTVDFTVPDTNSTTYEENSPDVNVTKQRRYVKLQANTTSVTAPDAVKFTATDSNGAPVNGTLTFDNQSVVINHTTVYTFETGGTYNVTLVPNDTATYDYYRDSSQATYEQTITVENATDSGSDSTTTVDLAVAVADGNGNTQTTFKPTETIRFTVTDASDSSAVANATVSVAGQTLETDSSGVATTTISETGDYVASITKSDTNETDYQNTSVNITVARETNQLNLVAKDSGGNTLTTANPNEELTFTVKDENSNLEPNATVMVAGKTLDTGSDATVTTSIDDTGEYTAVASKETANGVNYLNDSENFTIAKNVVDLSVTVDNGEGSNNGKYQVGNTVRFIVKGDGSAVANATVSVADKTLTTDSQGYATTTFDSAGTYEAVISKEDTENTTYRSTTTNVTIYTKDAQLKVTVSDTNGNTRSYYHPGTTLEFTVTEAGSGDKVANATVAVAGKTLTTDSSGVARTSIDDVGEYLVNVTKPQTNGVTYHNTTTNVTIARDVSKLDLVVKNLDGDSTTEFVPGQTILFKTKNANGYTVPNVTVTVAGQTLDSGSDGIVTTSIDTEGTYRALASKTNTSGVTYRNDSVNITVARNVVDLAVKVTDTGGNSQTTFRPTETIEFTVTEAGSGTAVANATISIAGQTLTTDSSGVARTSIDDTGEYTANVSKAKTRTTEYTSTSANVTIAYTDRKLVVTHKDQDGNTQGPFPPTSTLTFTVTEKSSGTPVPNATVHVAGDTLETNADGQVSRTFTETGDYQAVATKEPTNGYQYANDTTNFTISKRMEDVVLSVNESLVRPTEPIKLGADDTDGHDANGIVNFENGSKLTAINGTEVVTLPGPGTYNLTLVPNDTKTTNYTQGPNSNATVVVRYEEVQLTVSANRSSPIQPGQNVTFRTTDPNSALVTNTTVHVGDETLYTGGDGEVSTSFTAEEQGTYTVTATKNKTNGYEYLNGSVNVTVDAAGDELNITANESNPNRGESLAFTVTSDGTPVEDATVTLPNRTFTTDANGTVVTSFSNRGEVTASATKNGYEHDETTITVGDDAVVNLTLEGVGSVAENETLTANLTLSYAYEGVSGYNVVVTVPNNSTAVFNGSADYGEQFALGNVTVSENRTTVEFDAVDLNETVQSEAQNVSLGTLELVGVDNGTVNVSVSVKTIENDNGTAIETRTDNATLEVRDVPVIVGNETPNDLDHDGTYEDVNGNGEVDYNDVVALFSKRDTANVQQHADLFDYTDSGDFGYTDIVSLYETIQQSAT